MSSLLYCYQYESIKMCKFYTLNKNNKVFTKNSYICILHYEKCKMRYIIVLVNTCN